MNMSTKYEVLGPDMWGKYYVDTVPDECGNWHTVASGLTKRQAEELAEELNAEVDAH
jgi:hypothetical protein